MTCRVLVINWQDITHPHAGGAEVHAYEICKRLVKMGHQITFLCCGYKNAPRRETVDGIHIVRSGNRILFNFYVPFAYYLLRQSSRFDVVIDDINKIPFFTPLFVQEPVLAIVHHLFGRSIFLETGGIRALYIHLAEKAIRLVYRKIRFVAVSKSTQIELEKWGLHCLEEDIVYNGVDLNQYAMHPGLRSRTPLVGYLGRLKKYKCIEHLIQAFTMVLHEHPDARLLIVGEGDTRKRLEKMADRMGISGHVTFTGYVSHDQKVASLNRMWVVVNPSSKEGWGLTVIEANACGIPVIAADSPGLRESVVHDRTGFLFPWGDVAQMVQYILTLLNSKQLRNRMGQEARNWVTRYSWVYSALKVDGIIKNMLSGSEGEQTDT